MKVFLRIGIVLALIVLAVNVVSAHAKLVRANPAPNTVLGNAPSQVQLWYDEPLELNFSEVQVFDANRQRVDTGELQAVAGDAYSVLVPLKAIGDGTYTVIWKVLSSADGHITRGVFAFGVGNTAGVVSAPIDSGTSSAASELTPLSAVVRWVSLLSLLALVGGFVFRFFLLERSLEQVDANKHARKIGYTRWLQLTAFAFVLFFVGVFGELALQVNLIADQLSFTSVFTVLLNSRFGTLWLLRVGLMALCGVLVILEARRVAVPYTDYALIVLGNVALLTRSLISHSAGYGNVSLPVFADWLHLLGVALWVGGLFYFAWLMPFVWRALEAKTRAAWIAWLVPQFSIMAIGATIVIALTGFYNSTQQIPALDILTTNTLPTFEEISQGTYNTSLLAKIALFGVMVAFGALNLLFLSPRFRQFISEPDKSARLFTRFRVTVGAEVLLGVSVIFLAGVLTLTPPPRSEPEQLAPTVVETLPERPLLLVGYPSSDVQVQLEVGPNPRAPNLFSARVTDESGHALDDIQRVIFSFMYLNEDMGLQNVTADARGENVYAAEGNYLPLEGMWKIQVRVRRQGLEDALVNFPFYVAPRFGEDTTPVMTAQLELQRAQDAMNALTALRSTQELNDGASGVARTVYEYQAPDKTKFEILGQGASIAIGADQFYQNRDGQWIQRARVENFMFPKFDFAATAQGTRIGRTDRVDGEPAQVVVFNTPNTSGTELIHYAYWLDAANKRVLQIAMVTESHYMMQYYFDFDDPALAIAAPPNAVPAPTPAPVVEGGGNPLQTAVQGSPRPRGFITGDLEGDGALIMVVVGVVILVVGSGGKRNRNTRLVTLGIGAASVLLGIGLFVDAVNGTLAANQNIPVNTTRASTGQLVYQQNCAVCHGEKGFGDGPGGAALPVKPFDLTTHVLLHDEQYLYATILNGRGYMPAFGPRLSQDEILDVIAYTRLLARQAQQGGGDATPRPGFTPQP